MKKAGKVVALCLSFMAVLSACQRKEEDKTPVSEHKWTWVSGSKTVNQTGSYGTQGVAASSNIPGAREQAISWRDASGNFWLFGGYGYDSVGYLGQLNDLWKFNPTSLEWTWISGSRYRNQTGIYGTKGVPAPANIPGARRGAVSWIDPGGHLWLLGGLGYDDAGQYVHLNDLWKFDPAALEWTWMSGSETGGQAGTYGTKGTPDPSNIPGARIGAVSWISPGGNLWLFGGYGHDSAGDREWLNDLWKYNPATLEWTWISGSETGGQAGTYGTKGTADPANVPGGRYMAASWIDSGGVLWLFGGDGLDSKGSRADLNDLWKYDPTALEWTWVSGGETGDKTGVYGTITTEASSNVPGGRYAAVTWIDSGGVLWLFGGCGLDSAGAREWLNDLWKYNPTTLQWAWMSGSNTGGQAGRFGTQGTGDTANVAGARYFALSWIDAQGRFWFFGGYGSDSDGTGGWLNDLWHVTK